MLVPWGSLHTHSRYSAKDALNPVQEMVAQAVSNGYGAIGLTDHGTIAGIFDLYRSAKKAGIAGVPGCEMYVAFDKRVPRPQTWHMGVLAQSSQGWSNLVSLVNMSHKQYKYKPIIDLADIQRLGENGMLEGLWATTGCFFGVLETTLRTPLLVDPEAAMAAGRNIVTALARAFKGRVLVELQNHGIEEDDHSDDSLVFIVDAIAQQTGMPTIITTDSHYSRGQYASAHETLKRLSSWSDSPDDAVFPGNGYWLASEDFMRRRFEPVVWDAAMEGFDNFMEDFGIVVPDIDEFRLKVPKLRSTPNGPDTALALLMDEAKKGMGKAAVARIDEEMAVVQGTGFSSYLLLTAEVTEFCREEGIKFAVRGSASGSIICLLLGITQVDPLKWSLRFDRFLSSDRSKPPDVDIDVQHDRRQEVLDFLSEHYSVTHIGTWRELGESKEEMDKGSVWVKWATYARKTGAVTDQQVRSDLTALADMRPLDGIGVNAAGVLVVPGAEHLSRMPMQWIASSKTMVCALDKDEIEALGYVKLDVLGLRTLTAIKEMEETTGIEEKDVPMREPKTMAMIRKGLTDGVFQLNGEAVKRGLPRLRPTKFDDIVVALALFRPAVMQSGAMDEYLALRSGTKRRRRHHPLIEKHVSLTHGVVMYQEQVLGLMREMGMDPVTLNAVLKAVKASNSSIGSAAAKMDAAMGVVRPLAKAAGFGEEDIAWLTGAMEAYASYGFNLAHAVSYAHLSWRTAWYKQHHPVDFWSAILNAYSGGPKEQRMRAACRRDGVYILNPDVNKSGVGYTVDRAVSAVRSGIISIAGIGEKAASALVANGPYKSITELANRNKGNRSVTGIAAVLKGHTPEASGGVVKALFDANALKGVSLQQTRPEEGAK